MKSLKPLLLLGALLGFATGVLLGLAKQSDWPSILWRSTAAALGFGVLLRWWGRCWTDSLRVAQQERYAAIMSQRREQRETKSARATKS